MKRLFVRFAPAAALLAIGIFGVPRLANTTPPPERHPHIRAAAAALREAQEELRTGATDFCGHKADAMRDVAAAQRQLQYALECDRR